MSILYVEKKDRSTLVPRQTLRHRSFFCKSSQMSIQIRNAFHLSLQAIDMPFQQTCPVFEVSNDIASEVGPAILLLAFLSHLDELEVVECSLDEVKFVCLELEKVSD
jgi:hypothetical protein